MWQKCPVCNGTGNSWQPYINEVLSLCKTCNGKGIISELTGLPPKDINQEEFQKINFKDLLDK